MLIDPLGRELITLNPVGALVWQALDGRRDCEVVAQHVAESFKDIEPAAVSRDVETFLNELERLNLVEQVDAAREPTERASHG